jgi:hypothetical protein
MGPAIRVVRAQFTDRIASVAQGRHLDQMKVSDHLPSTEQHNQQTL